MSYHHTHKLTLSFGQLAVGTPFTLSGYFPFIYEKGARSRAILVGDGRDERSLMLDDDELVNPVFLAKGLPS